MSSTADRTPDARLEGLRAEARYRRERLDLYRARAYGSGLVTEAGMRLRERECENAEERLRRAESETVTDRDVREGSTMGDILSILAVAVLLALIVVSVRKQRAATANESAELEARVGSDNAQRERSMAHRARVRARSRTERRGLSLESSLRGHSSAGRASGLHPEGRGFESRWLHLVDPAKVPVVLCISDPRHLPVACGAKPEVQHSTSQLPSSAAGM